jgi:hypothetical protein
MVNSIYGFYKVIAWIHGATNPFEFDLLLAVFNGITNKEISIVNLLPRFVVDEYNVKSVAIAIYRNWIKLF